MLQERHPVVISAHRNSSGAIQINLVDNKGRMIILKVPPCLQLGTGTTTFLYQWISIQYVGSGIEAECELMHQFHCHVVVE
jgi:hypothetical protein